MKPIIRYLYDLCAVALLGLCLGSCAEEEVLNEPYAPGKPSLGIELNQAQAPVPSAGLPGTEVTITAYGLQQYRDELIFRFNGEQATITEVTDSQIKVIVPDYASTGITTISIGDVVIFGPLFSVTGKISVDPTFNVTQGTNGGVEKIITTADGRMLAVGAFTNFDNRGTIRPINRIARTFADGTYDASLRSGTGANGVIGDIVPFNNGYLISGAFSGYAQRGTDISNLTYINGNGTIDTMGVHPFRRPDQLDTVKYYPSFNGGFDQWVDALYPQGNKVVVNGSFRYYISRRYDQPNRLETRDSVIMDSVEVRQFARLNADGSLDSTYRFDRAAGQSWEGGNGEARSSLITAGPNAGKLMVYGSFTRFDGQQKGYILRLNADGTIDDTFNPGGSGADQRIRKLFYNPSTGRYVIAGDFRNYNGQPANRLALLNEDGSLDASFVAKEFEGGGPTFIKQLSDGKIIVSGDFRSYAGYARNGFMVLDEQGDLIPGYNATGIFEGQIEDIMETTAANGQRALMIYGYFSIFNSTYTNNIVRIIME
jgi:IPT/TIG domain.